MATRQLIGQPRLAVALRAVLQIEEATLEDQPLQDFVQPGIPMGFLDHFVTQEFQPVVVLVKRQPL